MPSLTFLYINAAGEHYGVASEPRLAAFTERHKIQLAVPPLQKTTDIAGVIAHSNSDGIVFEMMKGWADLEQVRLTRVALHSRKRAWFYWPAESAIECIDDARLRGYRNLYGVAASFDFVRPAAAFAGRFVNPARAILNSAKSLLSPSQL